MATAGEHLAIDMVRYQHNRVLENAARRLARTLEMVAVEREGLYQGNPHVHSAIMETLRDVSSPPLDASKAVDIIADTCAAAGMPLTEAQRLLVAVSIARSDG